MDNSQSWIVFDSSFEGGIMGVSTLKSEGWRNLVIMDIGELDPKKIGCWENLVLFKYDQNFILRDPL
jgi:hypothetical protein